MNPMIAFKRKWLWSLFNKNCRVKPHIWLTLILPKHFVMPIGLNSPKLYKYFITLLLTTFLMPSLQLMPLGLKHKQMPCVWQGWQQQFSRCCCSHWLHALPRSLFAWDIGPSQVRAPKYKTSVLSTSHKICSCYNRWWPSKKGYKKKSKNNDVGWKILLKSGESWAALQGQFWASEKTTDSQEYQQKLRQMTI